MPIVFLSLFLGLVAGPQEVSWSVGPGVKAVEILLDGARVAKVSGPPWQATVDLGSGLLPHHLEARALGADGSEAGRAEQWINLPQPKAEVEIVLEKSQDAKTQTIRLAWQSRTGQAPSSIDLTFDDRPLAVASDGRATLPAAAEGLPHVVVAELRFPFGFVARKQVVLSVDEGSQVETELTAVAVRSKSGKLRLEDVSGRLAASGKVLKVTAVDKDLPQVIVVRSPGVEARAGKSLEIHLPRLGGAGLRSNLSFDGSLSFRFIHPVARVFAGRGEESQLFDLSQSFRYDSKLPLSFLLTQLIQWETPAGGNLQLADAVAVAGLQALEGQTPRAVLLVLCDPREAGSDAGKRGSKEQATAADTADTSRYPAAAVRRYLDAIGVPLVVWSAGAPDAIKAGWGPVEELRSTSDLVAAYERLKANVDRQQIVWLEGRHLPQAVRLVSAAAVGPVSPGISSSPSSPPLSGSANLSASATPATAAFARTPETALAPAGPGTSSTPATPPNPGNIEIELLARLDS